MSQAAINAQAFTEMKELMGDTFGEIISVCLEALPEQNEKLALAIETVDAEQVFNIAHRLKSTCGTIGAFGLAEKVEIIERIGREGSTQGANAAYSELQISLQEVLSHLQNEKP
jgi:HPt (histidine-containing phosphotransfer) domain-containing protein